MESVPEFQFEKEMHKKYLKAFLNQPIPSFLSSMDSNRSVLMFFCIGGLDILGDVEKISQERKTAMINWIYNLQVINTNEPVSGFQGSTTLNTKKDNNEKASYQWGHIATTYSCLLSLLILGDNLERVNRKEILKNLQALQLENGCFKGAIRGTESDMRFIFCAASISYILNDWQGIVIDKMCDYIIRSISYDGGIGQGPNLESHCGSTFCGLAALFLSKNLHILNDSQIFNVRRWLLTRFNIENFKGFNGRPNKPADTCYSFWAGAALKLLNAYQFIESEINPNFVLMTQDKYGGFSKWINSGSDPMHTYFGLAGLSLMNFEDLSTIFPALNCTKKVHDHLKEIHLQNEKLQN